LEFGGGFPINIKRLRSQFGKDLSHPGYFRLDLLDQMAIWNEENFSGRYHE